jgi:uracil-DNA glycosylase family 4
MTGQVEALKWYVDHGVDAVVGCEPVDRFKIIVPDYNIKELPSEQSPKSFAANHISPPLGASDAKMQAIDLAQASKTLDELKIAIQNFDGIGLKKTATNMVFSDGNPKSRVMVVGDAPAREDDVEGKPFMGANGQLLDKILSSIGLSRHEQAAESSVYLSNIINWRPPGNRSPNPGELEASLPFIERHIQLINPEIVVLCGAMSAKALLGRQEGLSKLRKATHVYAPHCVPEDKLNQGIKMIATYHPSYLMVTPLHKRAVWDDMLKLQSMLT